MKPWEYQEAIFASNMSYKAKLVGLAISYYYNWKESSPSFPSIETLTERTSLSRASVHRAKLELVSQGYLVQHRKYDQSNRYLPQIPGMSQTETTLVSQGRTNNEVNNEVNNVLSKSSFQSDFDTVVKNIITEDKKEIEDDPAAWTEEQRRAWFLSDTQGSNRDTQQVYSVSTRDNRYINEVPEFLQGIAEARAQEW